MWNDGVDIWWHDEMSTADSNCEPEWMDAEDPLFMLYTRYIIKIIVLSLISNILSDRTADKATAS